MPFIAGINETKFWWSRPRPRLELFESQCRDWDRDWIYKSLNFETETETESLWVSMSRPRPRLENFFFCYEILFMSRPKLIETRKFCGCRNRDSSRLGNSLVVKTETHRDLEILWLSRPRLNETGNFCGCRDRDQSRLNKSCRDWDFIESLADLWFHTLFLGKKKKVFFAFLENL